MRIKPLHISILALCLPLLLAACTAAGAATPAAPQASDSCPVTEAVLITPPEDAAVNDPPAPGYYFVNEDQSILASAWWTDQEKEFPLRAGEVGNKVGWFRPAGAALEITGRRLDGQSAPLDAHVPCCYPTSFQATGLTFPTPGCWEVTARAAGSLITFVVKVEPEE